MQYYEPKLQDHVNLDVSHPMDCTCNNGSNCSWDDLHMWEGFTYLEAFSIGSELSSFIIGQEHDFRFCLDE